MENVFTCCVAGCSNNVKNSRNEKVTFFHFPHHNKSLMQQWVQAIKAKHLHPTSSTRICSSHFETRYIIRKPGADRLFLAPESVPTLISSSAQRNPKDYQRTRRTSLRIAAAATDPSPKKKKKFKEVNSPQNEPFTSGNEKKRDINLHIKKEPMEEKKSLGMPEVPSARWKAAMTSSLVGSIPSLTIQASPKASQSQSTQRQPTFSLVKPSGSVPLFRSVRLQPTKGAISNKVAAMFEPACQNPVEIIKVEPQVKDFEAIAANCSNKPSTTNTGLPVGSFVLTLPKKMDKSVQQQNSGKAQEKTTPCSPPSDSSSRMVSILDKFTEDDMSSPTKALEYFVFAKHTVSTQRKLISDLKQSLEKITTCIGVLHSEKKISTEVSNRLKLDLAL